MNMKLWKFLFSVFLCCIILLSACHGSNNGASPNATPAPAPGEAYGSENSPVLEMEMALSGAGIFGTEISGDQNGAYFILPNTGDYSGRLLYYDYATRQLIYLSDQMVVTNDEENPGWLEDIFGGAVPLAVNGKLYVVKYGKSPIPNINYEGAPSFLLQMEPNAASRKKLTVPQGCLLSYNTGIAADGQNLYLLLLDYDANAMQITNTALCRTNFDENKLERLCQLGKEREGNIIGVYPEGLVLQRSWISSEYAGDDLQDQLPHLQYELQLYSLRENRLTDTGFAWTQGELSFTARQGIVYFVKSGGACLYAHNLQNGKEWIVTDNIFGEAQPTPAASVMLMGEIRDNHIMFSSSTGEHTRYYSYNLTTQETLPLSLSFTHEGGEIPVFIQNETDQYFLVNGGMMNITRSATGLDGSLYTVDSSMTEYMLIKKEDYWNSVPNYIPFDDTLFQSVDLSV